MARVVSVLQLQPERPEAWVHWELPAVLGGLAERKALKRPASGLPEVSGVLRLERRALRVLEDLQEGRGAWAGLPREGQAVSEGRRERKEVQAG